MRERPIRAVPRPALFLLALGLALQIAWHWHLPPPQARAEDLSPPPSLNALRLASFGEPVALAKLLMLDLQAFDSQPGLQVSFGNLDYERLSAWLTRILELDPQSQYPLFSAIYLYGGVQVEAKQRQILDFIYHQFLLDPNHRWQWLTLAAPIAKHRLHDLPLARKYTRALRLEATGKDVPSWVRQMEIFILEDMNELESAKVLLAGLLASGQITDPNELRFLSRELENMEAQNQASKPFPGNRRALPQPETTPDLAPPTTPQSLF